MPIFHCAPQDNKEKFPKTKKAQQGPGHHDRAMPQPSAKELRAMFGRTGLGRGGQ